MFSRISKVLSLLMLAGVLVPSQARAQVLDHLDAASLEQFGAVVPDDPRSTVTIVGPWDEEQDFQVRVVSLSNIADAALMASPSGEDSDGRAPGRTAVTVAHPATGELVRFNIVEIGVRRMPGGRVEYVLNNELPFSRAAELEALARGESIRRQAPLAGAGDLLDRFDSGDPVCHRTLVPVIEVFVMYDAGADRGGPPLYGLQVLYSVDGDQDPLEADPERDGGLIKVGGDAGGAPGVPSFRADKGKRGGGEDGSTSTAGGDPGGDAGIPERPANR